MQLYNVRYQAHDGDITEEMVAAKNERGAISQVIPKGVPISAKPSLKSFTVISTDYKTQFLQAILFHVQSGMSAGRALEEIIKAEKGPIRSQLNPSLYMLMAGGAFSDAMEALGIYDSATIAMLKAGEKIGAMNQALKSAVEFQNKASASKKLLYGVMMTLSIDIIFSVVSTLGIQFRFLPMVKEQGIKDASPEATEAFYRNLEIAFWVNGFMSAVTVALVIGVAWFVYAYNYSGNPKLKYKLDRWLATNYFMRDVFSHSAIATTFSMCGTLLKGGIPLHKAIEIIKGISLSPLIEEFWSNASRRLEAGEPVAGALKSPLLQGAEILIIGAHKDSAQLAAALSSISLRRDELATDANKKFGRNAFWTAMAYSSVSVLIALWASYLQYTAMMSSMMGAGG
jgi:type II secretory pathway component PulF